MTQIVQTSDFTGEYFIAQGKYADLSSQIERTEKVWLAKLLGAELSKLFIADIQLDHEPDETRFVTIFDEFVEDYGSEVVQSSGIKEMLKGLIYYEYVPKTNVMHTQTGLVSSLNENSTPQTEARGAQFIMNHYYKAIKTYNAIQWYIEQHKSDYPEYNGIPVEPQGMII